MEQIFTTQSKRTLMRARYTAYRSSAVLQLKYWKRSTRQSAFHLTGNSSCSFAVIILVPARARLLLPMPTAAANAISSLKKCLKPFHQSSSLVHPGRQTARLSRRQSGHLAGEVKSWPFLLPTEVSVSYRRNRGP